MINFTYLNFSLEYRGNKQTKKRQKSRITFHGIENATYINILVNVCLLEEVHKPEARDTAHKSDATKSSCCCQLHEFTLGSLFASWVLSHHQKVSFDSDLGSSCTPRHNWKNCVHNNHFSIIRNSLMANLQQLQAMLITPIAKNPLKNLVQKSHDVNKIIQYCINL